MSPEAELDIRWPIGLLFLALGALVAIYGAIAPDRTHLLSAWDSRLISIVGINLNLVWGVVMLLFGAFMTLGARRASRRREEVRPADKKETAHHRA